MSPRFLRPARIEPGPGQESVWDYPRPPRIEPVRERLRVMLGGRTIADSVRGFRVLETSHPPNYYVPVADVLSDALTRVDGSTFCEWKGHAHYFDVRSGDRHETRAAWGYDDPTPAFADLAGTVAFYAGRMEACFVGDEQVEPQPGGFYGGWITSRVVGPFKGAPGTTGW